MTAARPVDYPCAQGWQVIKRLWQFPAVIGGTALLTFCGVSALQASMNGPLHAFGASVEAARASASASAAALAVAAGAPVRDSEIEVGAEPPSVEANGAAVTPSPKPLATSASVPSLLSAADGGASPGALADTGADSERGSDEQGAAGQAGGGVSNGVEGPTGPGAVLGPAGNGSTRPGLPPTGTDQQGRHSSSSAVAEAAAPARAQRLSGELSRWLGLTADAAGGNSQGNGPNSGSQGRQRHPGLSGLLSGN